MALRGENKLQRPSRLGLLHVHAVHGVHCPLMVRVLCLTNVVYQCYFCLKKAKKPMHSVLKAVQADGGAPAVVANRKTTTI
jgi:hypothetical protein